MSAVLDNMALGLAVVIPLLLIVMALQALQAVPADPSRLMALRRGLARAVAVLFVVFAVVVAARFALH